MNAIAEAQILLVEDNPGDGELVQEALRNARIANALYIVKDGVEAMSFLRREGHFAGKPTPDLVLLDINLPKKNGHEVLAEIRADPKLSSLAVVVLTTSNQERDVIKSYANHANAYITKPLNGREFIEVVRHIESFWLTLVRLPPKV